MNKKDVVEIVKEISTYYGNKFKMDDPKAIIDVWFKILKDYEIDEIMVNLGNYVKNNPFAPSVADLIKVPERRDRAVLNQDETNAMMQGWQKGTKATKDQADAALSEIRELLGIKRE